MHFHDFSTYLCVPIKSILSNFIVFASVAAKDGTNLEIQDCSRFIRHSFPLVDAGRPCYDMSSSKKPTCKCNKAPFPAPDIPDFPSAMQPAHSTWI